MNLQSNYDLAVARQKDAARIEKEVVRYRSLQAESEAEGSNRPVNASSVHSTGSKTTPAQTDELQELRHKYKAAYTSYMHSVQALSDATQKREWPSAEWLKLEEQAIEEVASRRRALLDALYARARSSRRWRGAPTGVR
jgi:hypothetical protein